MTFLRRPEIARALAALFSIAVFALALWVLHRAAGRFDLAEVTATARAYPAQVLVAALVCSMASYVALCGFDWLGIHHVGRTLPAGWIMLTSFVSHAVSHNAGFAVLTGGSVRLRMYSTFGLDVAQVGGIIAFAGLSFGLGVMVLAGGAFLLEGERVAPLLRLPPGLVFGLGWAIAAVLALYFAWTALARRPIAIGRWKLASPSLRLALGQTLIASMDLALVAAALYALLPLGETGIGFPAFVGLYVVATIAGTLSHVPGGIGVFESALVLLLPDLTVDAILAAMLVFRVFYNLLPLVLAAVILAVFELVQRRRHGSEAPWIATLGPALGGLLAFAAGTVLLATGSGPPPPSLPLWLAEPAHLLSGAVAGVLLAVSWGLYRQASWAYSLTLGGLGAGALLALLRGPDWLSAAMAAGCLAVIVAAAPLFHRRPNPDENLPWGWAGAGGAVIAVSAWLAWHGDPHAFHLLAFSAGQEGARAMRADLVALAALLAAVMAARFIPEPHPPTGVGKTIRGSRRHS